MEHKPCKVERIGFGETAWILKMAVKEATLPNIMDNVLGYCETKLQARVKRKKLHCSWDPDNRSHGPKHRKADKSYPGFQRSNCSNKIKASVDFVLRSAADN
eukprot:TRINITY_DN205_c0_g1_i2.p1 TRINITY_DN205_c0_g1~~TRINITY_DN205_c0_g1_i2.p1  ORF type:complete len:102 (+),score=15.55 TRINITY_DN205_c0_g1_i2:268-573(+)